MRVSWILGTGAVRRHASVAFHYGKENKKKTRQRKKKKQGVEKRIKSQFPTKIKVQEKAPKKKEKKKPDGAYSLPLSRGRGKEIKDKIPFLSFGEQ
jgi:hypothetical protein